MNVGSFVSTHMLMEGSVSECNGFQGFWKFEVSLRGCAYCLLQPSKYRLPILYVFGFIFYNRIKHGNK